uniref:Phospholipase/carboxylesterase/thioesterase domain-containing protein n=1 Tax=Chenopodium quinoa TaxID=63459 RepID=A0A803MGF9_CHEQI
MELLALGAPPLSPSPSRPPPNPPIHGQPPHLDLRCTATPSLHYTGFDVTEISEDSQEDLKGLDASALHIANLLSTEPADVKLGIGGFSMGAAVGLYSASCFAVGKYANGNFYPINLRAIVGLSGWLLGARRAASLPIFLCHGKSDEVVAYRFGEKSAQALTSAGFRNLTFKNFDGYVQASMSFAKTTVNHLQSICFTGFCLVNLFNRRGIMFGHTAGLSLHYTLETTSYHC